MKTKKIAVFGAGAWGTALAVAMARGKNHVTLFPSFAEESNELNADRENKKYLPDIALPESLQVSVDYALLSDMDIILWVVPAQYSRTMGLKIQEFISPHTVIVICSKGIDCTISPVTKDSLLTSVLGKIFQTNPLAVLSGPNFAIEVAKGLPAAATLASSSVCIIEDLAKSLRTPSLRIYTSDDPIGVQVGGAVKNVLAIASGIVVARQMGNNINAAFITRGLAEMRRLGVALGGKSETFLGLSAVGDLILTCSSLQSRNMALGLALGDGKSLKEIMDSRHTVAEGVYTAEAVHHLAALKNVRMPICQAVYDILYQGKAVDDAIQSLLLNQSEWEND
ncbi:MAG: NAD(P)-dependent glycerol-3-phosphate dehydrogenase [Alphaproteobacteria bacterium]|nr:NAD(P)-dependent glycerol-3-phosphate dehydrogenase [Alphaproteobacteria bacterium]